MATTFEHTIDASLLEQELEGLREEGHVVEPAPKVASPGIGKQITKCAAAGTSTAWEAPHRHREVGAGRNDNYWANGTNRNPGRTVGSGRY